MFKDARRKIYEEVKKLVIDVLGSLEIGGSKIYSSDDLKYFPDILLDQVEEDVKKDFKELVLKDKYPDKPIHILMRRRCEDYVYKIQNDLFILLPEIKKAIKSYRVIVFLGAGFSVSAGIPLTNELKNILKNIGVSDFSELSKNKKKGMEFKERFIKDILEKGVIKETKAYDVVVEEFEKGKIIEIITTNWDNLLEKVYEKKIS